MQAMVLKAVATTCESSEIILAASDVSTRTQALAAFRLILLSCSS